MTIAFAEENPFFKPFDRPYGTAPFNDIKMEHFEPAFEKGMEEHKVEIDKIASNSDAPTFENTIAAMEYSGKTLNRVSSVFFNLLSAESNDEMMEISQRLSPKLSAHSNYINLNEDLFKRVKSIYDERNSLGLTPEQIRLVEKYYEGFENSGATLSPEDKEKYRALTMELSKATLEFGQNVLRETNAFEMLLTDESDLAGLPKSVIDAAAAKAKSKGKEGWLFDLSAPSLSAFMKYSSRRDLREKLYMANSTKNIKGGEFDRNGALTWARNQSNFYGGETVRSGNEPDNPYQLYPRFPNVPYEASYAQTTHLNTSYSSAAYSLWSDFIYNEENVTVPFTPQHDGVTRTAIFDPVYDGRNGMEFMRDRLGYRLVLRDANASKQVRPNGTLKFRGKLQNVGFGLIVNKKQVSVILKNKNGSTTYSVITDIDARDWTPSLDNRPTNKSAWHDLNFKINMSKFGIVESGEYDIYLKINDPKEKSTNKRSIRFANNGEIWNTKLGANLIGSVAVK